MNERINERTLWLLTIVVLHATVRELRSLVSYIHIALINL